MRQPYVFAMMAIATVLGACSDNSNLPTSGARSGVATLPITNGTNATLSQTDTTRFSIVIDPSTTTTSGLGEGNTVVFPAGAICDLSSSYGPSEWDKPCTVATAPVTVNVKAWLTANNHPAVDFSPNVRFSPDAPVTINFTDEAAVDIPWSKIKYCFTASSCVDESVNDASLRTQKDAASGKLYRRVKHFSGYTVDADCDILNDPLCVLPDKKGTVGAPKLPVAAVVRDTPLPAGISASKMIGAEGGEISLPEAGLTVTIPRGALSAATQIVIRAREGRAVAYDFGSNAVTFRVPVVLQQSLRGTNREGKVGAVRAAMLANGSQLYDKLGWGMADSVTGTNGDSIADAISFTMTHFSGYALLSD